MMLRLEKITVLPGIHFSATLIYGSCTCFTDQVGSVSTSIFFSFRIIGRISMEIPINRRNVPSCRRWRWLSRRGTSHIVIEDARWKVGRNYTCARGSASLLVWPSSSAVYFPISCGAHCMPFLRAMNLFRIISIVHYFITYSMDVL